MRCCLAFALLFLSSTAVAYPNKPGLCNEGKAAVIGSGTHDTGSSTGTLSEGSISVIVGEDSVADNKVSVSGNSFDIKVAAKNTFKGMLIRVSGTTAEQVTTKTQGMGPADECKDVGSIGHTAKGEFTEATASVTVDKPGKYMVDITVVQAVSEYYYDSVEITVAEGGGEAPVAAEPAPTAGTAPAAAEPAPTAGTAPVAAEPAPTADTAPVAAEPAPTADTASPTMSLESTLWAAMEADEDLKNFRDILENSREDDYMESLKGDESNFTLFVPTKDALSKLDTKYFEEQWRVHLWKIIDAHWLTNAVMKAESFTDGQNLTFKPYSVAVSQVTVSKSDDGISFTGNNFEGAAKVVQADIVPKGQVAVAHKIDKYFVPDVLTKTLLESAEEEESLDYLVKEVKDAGIEEDVNQDGITIFAPSQDAFEKFPQYEAIKGNKKALVKILKHHIVKGIYPWSSLKEGMVLEALDGSKINVTKTLGVKLLNGESKIQKVPVMASNGLAYPIEKVLGFGKQNPAPAPTAGDQPTGSGSSTSMVHAVIAMIVAAVATLAI